MRFRHKKSGGTYYVSCIALREEDLTPVVVYIAEANGTIWVRPAAEFFDGRFEALAPLAHATFAIPPASAPEAMN